MVVCQCLGEYLKSTAWDSGGAADPGCSAGSGAERSVAGGTVLTSLVFKPRAAVTLAANPARKSLLRTSVIYFSAKIMYRTNG
jgi:hypothetical protein